MLASMAAHQAVTTTPRRPPTHARKGTVSQYLTLEIFVMLFEIPLADGRIVYMDGAENGVYSIVWVCPQKFYALWHDSQRLDIKGTRKKYHHAEAVFKNCINSPVEMFSAGIFDYENDGTLKIKLNDGITRTTWLLNNNAHCFPLLCSLSDLPTFLQHVSTQSSLSPIESKSPQSGQERGKGPGAGKGLFGRLKSFFKVNKNAS